MLERLSPPPGEMFSPLYGNGRTTLCAMSAPVQEKQAALSQLPARLLPPAVRASPRAVRAKIVGLAQTPFGVFGSHSSTGGASRLGQIERALDRNRIDADVAQMAMAARR